MEKRKHYYQIDYIDSEGYANYIDTFSSRELKEAIEHVNILNNANACLNDNTYFVLDAYAEISEDESELIKENITNATSLKDLRKEGVK